MTRLLNRLEAIPPNVANLAFWVAFATVLFAMILPLWIGTVTPMTDFGGHLQMIDAYVRADSLPALDERTMVRQGLFTPNMLPARFADILYPHLSPTSSIRLFLTLVIVSLAGALLLCIREFGRSRLLVFVGLPFFWGGMTGLGLINYVGIYPCLLLGIVFSRRFGRGGTAADGAALLFVSCLAFFMHGLGYLFVLGLSGLSLLLTIRRMRDVWRLGAWLPSLCLWLYWAVTGPLSHPGSGGIESASQRIRTLSITDKLAVFRTDALDVLVGTADEVALISLLLVLVVWFLGPSHEREASEAEQSLLRRRPLWILWLATLLSIIVLPTYVGTILIDTRLITPSIMLFCLLPLPLVSQGLMRLLGAAAVLIALGFGWNLSLAASVFEARETEPLTRLMKDLPRDARAECVQVGSVNPVFKRRPLSHNCNAVLQITRDSFAGAGFAYTRFNAIHFKTGVGYHSLRRGAWQRSRALQHWDYVVVRGRHQAPSKHAFTKLHTTRSHHALGTEWTLYAINKR